ncbi:MAG: dolichyl-phosphate beta-glucosyltransferase [Armatimonadota bacterium]|nr:dolichyl-phosphate beta-glucosyltransferase [Armatimonadota bacterium]
MDAAHSEIDLSIVIPAYNEEDRLGPTLRRVIEWLNAQPWDTELVVVDDGSEDRTAELARQELAEAPMPTSVLVNEGNRGKGYSVRRGMMHSAGGLALFSDADLSTPIEHAADLREAIEEGADIAIASRALADSELAVRQPLPREYAGRMFSVVQRAILKTGIRDTQCGFKMFTREAVEAVFPHQTLDRWAFDAELIFIAQQLGLRVVEVPVRWLDSPATKVNALRDGLQMVADLVYIRRTHSGLRPTDEP